MGKTDLDNQEYDNWLSENGKTKELKERSSQRRNANKGYEGWHFGIDAKPVYTKNKEDFKQALDKRGLLMRDDIRKDLNK